MYREFYENGARFAKNFSGLDGCSGRYAQEVPAHAQIGYQPPAIPAPETAAGTPAPGTEPVNFERQISNRGVGIAKACFGKLWRADSLLYQRRQR